MDGWIKNRQMTDRYMIERHLSRAGVGPQTSVLKVNFVFVRFSSFIHPPTWTVSHYGRG